MATNIVGGCIRFTDTGPQWHTNSAHVAEGMDTSVAPEINAAGDLVVKMQTSAPVVSATAALDETLAGREVTAGVSGGVSDCRIVFWKGATRLNLNLPGHYANLAGEWSNLWLTVVRVQAEVV